MGDLLAEMAAAATAEAVGAAGPMPGRTNGARRLVAYRQPELPIGNCIRTLRNCASASLACERLVIPAGRCAWLRACKRPGARAAFREAHQNSRTTTTRMLTLGVP